MTSQLASLRNNDGNFSKALEQARSALANARQEGEIDLEVVPRAGSRAESISSSESAFESADLDQVTESFSGGDFSNDQTASGLALEAVVRSSLRPSFYVSDDKILDQNDAGLSPMAQQILSQMDLKFSDRQLFDSNRTMLEKRVRSTGRLNLISGFREFAGTGFLVDENIVVTNRHVANLFAQNDSLGQPFFRDDIFGNEQRVELDSKNQFETTGRRTADVTKVLFIAGAGEPDIALLQVANPTDEPLELESATPEHDLPVAAIGYPAKDPRDNNPLLIANFFGEVFDVKRFAPGRITANSLTDGTLTHDASTLGGNSGSSLISLKTGKVVGLHFAGIADTNNFAVPSALVAAAIRQTRSSIAMPALISGLDVPVESSSAANFEDREGYDPEFLGKTVAMPGVGAAEDDLAVLNDGSGSKELKYCHFSVLQNAKRRLPHLTAVNINGAKLRRISRHGRWRLDGRLNGEDQVGNELYRRNPLDRGHMVRRLDPCWAEDMADDETVLKAQADTFHYTNSAPQHSSLNQRDWVGLEDYILDASEDFEFKVSIFTGPVFRDDDRTLKRQPGAEDIPIPREFWKVAVMLNKDTSVLSATGYVLSHGRMIHNLTEAEFVLGAYKTYQVPLALIEAEAGIDLDALKEFDPMNVSSLAEAAFNNQVKSVRGPDDLKLSP